MAGESRPGSFRAARLFFGSPRAVPGLRGCRRAGRGGDILLDLADQVLQIVGLPAQLDGACRARLRAPSRYRPVCAGAPGRARSSVFFPAKVRRDHGRAPRVRRQFRSVLLPARPGRPPSVSTSTFMSGSTAPNKMAARTDCSASSGLTSRAGGGRRPSLCRAASTSAITARRLASERRMVSSLPESVFSRRSVAAMRSSTARMFAAVPIRQLAELAAVLADRIELGLELGGDVGVALLLGPNLLQLFLPRTLQGLGRDRDVRDLRVSREAGGKHECACAHEPPRRLEEAGRGHIGKIGPKFIEEPLTFRIARRNSSYGAARSGARSQMRERCAGAAAAMTVRETGSNSAPRRPGS